MWRYFHKMFNTQLFASIPAIFCITIHYHIVYYYIVHYHIVDCSYNLWLFIAHSAIETGGREAHSPPYLQAFVFFSFFFFFILVELPFQLR